MPGAITLVTGEPGGGGAQAVGQVGVETGGGGYSSMTLRRGVLTVGVVLGSVWSPLY